MVQLKSRHLTVGGVALALAPAIAGVLAARGLGPDGRGHLAVALSITTIASIVAVRGLDAAVLSADITAQGTTSVNALLQLFDAQAWKATSREGAAGAMSFGLLTLGLGLPTTVATAGAVALLVGLSTDMLLQRSLNIRRGRTREVLAADLAMATTLVAATVAAWALDGGLFTFAIAPLLGVLAGALLNRWNNRATHLGFHARMPQPMRQEVLARLHGVSSPAFKSRLLLTIALRADRIILSVIAGPAAVGLYAAAVPIGEAASIFPNQTSQVVNARVAAGQGDARWHRFSDSLASLAAVMIWMLILAFGSESIIVLLYGDEFVNAAEVAVVLGVASLAGAFWRLAEAELFGRRETTPAIVGAMVASVSVLILTAALAAWIGAMAPAIASLVGYTSAAAIVSAGLYRARSRQDETAA